MADETKWAPEPWSIDETDRTIVDAKDSAVVVADDYALDWTAWGPDSRRRIVACVNACTGIPSAALEAGLLTKALDLVAVGFLADECDGTTEGCPSCEARRLLKALGRVP
jgi:hypothetical protein